MLKDWIDEGCTLLYSLRVSLSAQSGVFLPAIRSGVEEREEREKE